MEISTKQKNLAIYTDVADDFESLCDTLGLKIGHATSAALYAFIHMSAEERENAMTNLATRNEPQKPQLQKKFRMAGKSVGRNPRIEIDGKIINEGTDRKGKK